MQMGIEHRLPALEETDHRLVGVRSVLLLSGQKAILIENGSVYCYNEPCIKLLTCCSSGLH